METTKLSQIFKAISTHGIAIIIAFMGGMLFAIFTFGFGEHIGSTKDYNIQNTSLAITADGKVVGLDRSTNDTKFIMDKDLTLNSYTLSQLLVDSDYNKAIKDSKPALSVPINTSATSDSNKLNNKNSNTKSKKK